MPKIPTYQPNQVAPVQTTSARIRAADDNGGALGGLAQGMRAIGQAGGEYAIVQDHLNAQNDDTQARKIAINAAGQFNALRQSYTALQGANAREAQGDTIKQIETLRKQMVDQAANPRMRRMLEERLTPIYQDTVSTISGHAIQQQQVERKGVLLGAVSQSQDEAAGLYSDPKKFPEAVGRVRAAAQEFAEFSGLGEASGAYVKQQVGGVYANAALHALTAEDVPMAQAIFEAHGDDMTFEQRNQVFAALQKPLQDRDSAASFLEVVSGHPPASAGQTANVAPGTYKAPVAGQVTSRFGEARGSEKHSGLDIAAPMGAAIHPIAGGVVEAVTQDDRAGKWVKVKHPDGTTSTYAHMGNQSVKVGDEVTGDTVLGTVGVTGHTSGPHVHLVVRNAAGERVDPEKVIGGRAAGGQVVGSPSAARNWDQASVLAGIDARTDWTFEKRERVKAYARQQMAKDEAALSDQQADADEKAIAVVTQLGDKFTSITQIPTAIRARLSPSALARYTGAAKANTEPKEVKPNGPAQMTLNQMRILEPERFKSLNLAEYVGKVSNAEMDTLLTQQAELRVKKAGAWSPSSGITSAMSYGKKVGGLKLKDDEEAAIAQVMETEANALHARGVPDDQIDYNGLFRRATRNVATIGWFGREGSKPLYQMDASSIPDAWRKDAVAKWKRENGGQEPSEDQLLRLFRATYQFRPGK